MEKSVKRKGLIIWFGLIGLFLALSLVTSGPEPPVSESLSEIMKDAVLHDINKVNLLGVLEVNPGFISALICSALLLMAALLIRVFVIPRFTLVPGRFQLVLETIVGYFSDLARQKSHHEDFVLAGYTTAAAIYITFSTLFELVGVQAVSTHGTSMSLGAPLSDINGAIAMGVISYLFIMYGGIRGNGVLGIGLALKEFSLPISMSLRLFGALLSGLLVTELVYYTLYLSFVIPVLVAVAFTLIHAVIQTYVLTMLVSIFYGEVNEPRKKKAVAAGQTKGQ